MVYELKRGVAALALSVGVMGCAGSGGRPASLVQADPQKIVAELAAARWDAMIKGDFAKAYDFLSPGTRTVMSLDLYKVRYGGGNWKKTNVESVSCEQDQCKVVMAIEYSHRNMKLIETRLEENWLRQDGKWWYIPRR